MSAQPWEIRMARLEGAYEQVSQRLGGIEDRLTEQRAEGRFGQLDERIERLDEKLDRKFDRLTEKIDQRSLWMIGLILVSIVLPVAMRLWGSNCSTGSG